MLNRAKTLLISGSLLTGSCYQGAVAGETTGYFVADSFSFAVEREMKESGRQARPSKTIKSPATASGEKSGIRRAVGELQEPTITQSMDM
ncbi:MAG: hypothetical protein OES09_10205 [Gammaproteobacteria bacterium]|nr:hypothetical protein [Gammaproteobacteria bacterium]